jgi:predicted alpha-1,2-mannosidase
MNFRKTFLLALLGCTMLVSCDGSNDKTETAKSQGTFTDKVDETKGGVAILATEVDELKRANGTLSSQVVELKTAGTTNDATISALQTELASLAQIAKALKIETMQAHIADLQSELAKVEPNISALDTMTERTAALKARTAKAKRSDMSAKDLTEVEGYLQELASLEKEIGAEQAEISASMAKGEEILKAVRELPAGATVAQVTAIDDNITALSSTLKRDSEQLAAFDKGVTALKNKISDLTGQDLAEYVNTMRGAQSSGDFSRGNTIPATAMPFGFNMWSPVDRTDSNWFYQFKTGETGTLVNTIIGFGVVHIPSPWIGNRQSLNIMPIDNPTANDKYSRAQPFNRKNEIARAHYYSLTLDNGTKTEITPTDHAASFRFTAPSDKTVLTVVLDSFTGSGAFAFDAATGVISGFTEHGSPRMFFYATFDTPVTKSKKVASERSWVQFDVPDGKKVVGMRIATSFISVDQAKANLDMEIGGKTFDQIKDLAEDAWLQKLGTIRVKAATEDQKKILYSNMYRAFLYPNSAWENVNGVPTYMSPYTSPPQQKPGKIWVNNGFWDTYRTTWPLYTLMLPKQAGEMLDGFVNGYKDGGWVTRWSGPGYNDSMVATSSDVILADAYLKGVSNFDVSAAYASMLRNATTVSTENSKGRKGMDQMPFYGYSLLGSESVSWSLEAYLNDFGIAQMAKALKKDDDYAYFMNRAISYPNLFDGASTGVWSGGFFRAKNSSGGLSSGPSTPQSWGYGYTEGNAWSYAFLAPQDGQGLANLYGGRQKLKEKLDTFFKTDPGLDGGSYGLIHEVKEASTVDDLANVGEYQHSNQTVHHSIYMYNYAGAPANGQNYLRDVMDKLYFTGFDSKGNSTGEGYIGDEDNGEQSAWYILSAMGFYPVSMGRPEYAIGAPYFQNMSVTLENGKKITINAPNVSCSNRYVQSVKLNGTAITRNYLLHSELKEGAALDFEMGPNPSQWGTGIGDVPISITQGDKKPEPLKSLLPMGTYVVTASTDANKASVFDRTSNTIWASPAGTSGWIEAGKKSTPSIDTVSLYTLTSINTTGQDPTGWTLKGTNDGTTWVTLDTRANQTFTWQRQTRPFALKTPASYARYRLEFSGTSAVSVAEFELLGVPDNAPAPVAAAAPVTSAG